MNTKAISYKSFENTASYFLHKLLKMKFCEKLVIPLPVELPLRNLLNLHSKQKTKCKACNFNTGKMGDAKIKIRNENINKSRVL